MQEAGPEQCANRGILWSTIVVSCLLLSPLKYFFVEATHKHFIIGVTNDINCECLPPLKLQRHNMLVSQSLRASSWVMMYLSNNSKAVVL